MTVRKEIWAVPHPIPAAQRTWCGSGLSCSRSPGSARLFPGYALDELRKPGLRIAQLREREAKSAVQVTVPRSPTKSGGSAPARSTVGARPAAVGGRPGKADQWTGGVGQRDGQPGAETGQQGLDRPGRGRSRAPGIVGRARDRPDLPDCYPGAPAPGVAQGRLASVPERALHRRQDGLSRPLAASGTAGALAVTTVPCACARQQPAAGSGRRAREGTPCPAARPRP